MYIDPLTLFILGEFLVVYIIINVFLFYKGRLYKVLVALLKEMRAEKLRREQRKQKELAALRAKNKGLLSKNESLEETVKSAGKTISEQLEERIETLSEKHPNAHDLTNSVERDESAQWLRMRILELEKELLAGSITEDRWEELATEAISRLKVREADEKLSTENRQENAEDSRYTGQLENDLADMTRQFDDAKIRIRQLEGELEDIKTISTPSESHLETPVKGLYEDEIYRLKCDNFDLQESINKLKLELQQADPSAGGDAYSALLETQLANMEQYIKSADITQGLMEKELSAAQNQIEDLKGQLQNVGNAAGSVDLSSLSSLNDNVQAETDTLSSIKDTVARLRNGEEPEAVAAEQEAHVARLEQIIRESEQCISILENELSQSSQDIQSLEDALAKSKTDLLNSKLSGLGDTQSQQKEGVSNIRDLITEMRDGGDMDSMLGQQEQEIEKLEKFLAESDTLIGQLETEIDDLQQQLQNISVPVATDDNDRPESDEDIEEMEGLLQQFIKDIQGLMLMINRLEDQNSELQAQIEAERKSAQEAPNASSDATAEPVATDLKTDEPQAKEPEDNEPEPEPTEINSNEPVESIAEEELQPEEAGAETVIDWDEPETSADADAGAETVIDWDEPEASASEDEFNPFEDTDFADELTSPEDEPPEPPVMIDIQPDDIELDEEFSDDGSSADSDKEPTIP